MNEQETILAYITHIMIFIFLLIFIKQQNYEFMGYVIIAICMFWILMYVHKKYQFPITILYGFSLWMFLHMLGGTVILGIRIYDLILINIVQAPYHILRYDQVIHLYCYIVIGAIVYIIIKKHTKGKNGMLLVIAMITALGIGTLNEIIEFGMVVVLNATGVGDYYNTALDLVFNLAGAIIGVLLAKKYY